MQITLSKPVARDRAVEPYDIKQLKKALNRLGLYTPNEKTGITGIADTDVFNALKLFQSSRNLVSTPVIRPDDETIVALNREISTTPGGSYVWRTVEDGKVRGSHAVLNRTIRSWADSPDPGEDYNCRCWAQSLPPNEPDLGGVHPELLLLPPIVGRLAGIAINTVANREAIKNAVKNIQKIREKATRDTKWTLGRHKTAVKWKNQMQSRGWTDEKITDTIKYGQRGSVENKISKNNPATLYERNGNYVVRDETTKEILQVGDPSFERPPIIE